MVLHSTLMFGLTLVSLESTALSIKCMYRSYMLKHAWCSKAHCSRRTYVKCVDRFEFIMCHNFPTDHLHEMILYAWNDVVVKFAGLLTHFASCAPVYIRKLTMLDHERHMLSLLAHVASSSGRGNVAQEQLPDDMIYLFVRSIRWCCSFVVSLCHMPHPPDSDNPMFVACNALK